MQNIINCCYTFGTNMRQITRIYISLPISLIQDEDSIDILTSPMTILPLTPPLLLLPLSPTM